MPNLSTPSRAIFRQIQANLKDRYVSGFPVLKELIQNAEDANAKLIRFVAHTGWPEADNPLLRVAGILIVNDGVFSSKDEHGMLSFADSAKGDDATAIGRFGFGQKAVFHLCDAFIGHAFGQQATFSKVINPCLDVIPKTKAASWDEINDQDLALLTNEVSDLSQGLIIWLPLRHNTILPAPKLYFTDHQATLDELVAELESHEADLRLILASLRNLDRVELRTGTETRFSLHRANGSSRMQGLKAVADGKTCVFGGKIVSQSGQTIAYAGREIHAENSELDSLKNSGSWPQVPIFTDQGEEMRPEKAEAHGAIVLANGLSDTNSTTVFEWGVFLPVTQAMQIETPDTNLRILLHGYFFVDSGRRNIEGFDEGNGESRSIYQQWNKALRDEILLPLLPSVLYDALQASIFTGEQLAEFLSSLTSSRFGNEHALAFARKQCLIRKVENNGKGAIATWVLVPVDCEIRPLPAPDNGHRVATTEIFPDLCEWANQRDMILISGPEAALTQNKPGWHADEISDLFTSLTESAFQRSKRADILASFLMTAVGHDEVLREAVAPPLLDGLRRALTGQEALANQNQLREILSHLPPDTVVTLPPSASERRAILRALANTRSAPLCLHAEWLPEGAGITEIEPVRVAPLLASLEPLLKQDGNADAAGTAALALVKLLRRHLPNAINDSDIATLMILRAGDGTGIPKLICLRDLRLSAIKGRLFKNSPNVQQVLKVLSKAVRNSGALIVSGDAARLLEEIGPPFSFAEGKKETFATLVLNSDEFGIAEARANAMETIVTQSPEARRGLRVLAVGDRQAANDSTRIFALPQMAGKLDELVMQLIQDSKTDFLIPNAVLNVLNPTQQLFLGVETMDGPSLGKLLNANTETLSRMTLDDNIVVALLNSEVPDDDLGKLPIFSTEGGSKLPAYSTWRSSSSWRVPDALANVIQILKPIHNRKASERLERLVKIWSPIGQIETALAQPRPHEFITEILDALEHVQEPAPHCLRDARWIPDTKGTPWTPSDVLDLPREILDPAQAVLGVGDDASFVQISDVRCEVRDHLGFKNLCRYDMIPNQSRSVDTLLHLIEGVAPLALLGEVHEEEKKAYKQLAEIGADLEMPGWPLLSALIRNTEKNLSELTSRFGSVTEKHLSEAIDHINALARLAEEGKQAARTLYDSAFQTICNWRPERLHQAMGSIYVPVQSGKWKLGSGVVARVNGITPTHRLDNRLDNFWPEPSFELNHQCRQGDKITPERRRLGKLSKEEKNCANSLVPLIKHAQAGVPPQLLALLVGAVSRSKPFRDIVRTELGLSDTVVDQIWVRIGEVVKPVSIQKKVLINVHHVESQECVRLTSLANKIVELPVGVLEPLLVIGNRHRVSTVVRQDRVYNYKTLDIAPLEQPVDAKHVLRLLRTVLSECKEHRREVIEKLTQLANDYNEIEQTTVRDAQARLEDRLPQILAELKPNYDTALREALDEYEKKEQYLRPGREREQKLPGFKRELWKRLQSPVESNQLLSAVHKQIKNYGYSPDRILFELFQNADDASEQHEPPGRVRFRIEVSDTQLRVLHWGRLINHPGHDPDKGEQEGWPRDLFNMLLMNLSEKREGVTGRFGLGFKSVHLISREVGIASGFVACKIHGGMLPEVWEAGRQLSFDQENQGRRATMLQLSIDENHQESAIAAVEAFRETARWLPAMARCIRSIELDGEVSCEWHAESHPLSEGLDVVILSGSEPERSLALDLGEDTTLFLPLSSDGPLPAKEGLPRLWLLAPLAETLKSGWLMNGRQFQVDPGRGSLKRGDGEPQGTLERLGIALGEKLLTLADLIGNDWPEFALRANLSDRSTETGPTTFWTRLAELFALDLDDPLASHLHGPDKGYGRLVAERPVFPTRLPRPFTTLLRAPEVRHVVHGLLSEPSLLADLDELSTLDKLAASCVSQQAADQLKKLSFSRTSMVTLPEIVCDEIGSEKRIDPVLAQRLGRVLTKNRIDELDGREKKNLLEVLSKARFLMANDTWQEARYPPRNASDTDEEETRVLGFAPDEAVADIGYRNEALSLYRLAMRQSGFQRTPETFAHWAMAMSDDVRKTALLEYVLDGRQNTEVGKRLAQAHPSWLPLQADELRESQLVSDISVDELPRLLGLLYPDEQRRRWEPSFLNDTSELEVDTTEPHIDPSELLKTLHSWWEIEHEEERQCANKRAYPEFFSPQALRDASVEDSREEWFTFFALGIFRTIGRTNDVQHRSFIAAAHRDGWWKEMATAQLPRNPKPWVKQLEIMADANAWRIYFPQWRRSLSDLYVLARWLPNYVDAFKTLPDVIRSNGPVTLSDAWRLSYSPIWQRRGLEGAPLSQSLGLGANWMIREAVRHHIWTDENAVVMHPYGWASTGRMRRFLKDYLGEPMGDPGEKLDLSPDIHALMRRHLDDDANFLGDLDLPLQIVAAKRKRRRGTLQKLLSDIGDASFFSEEYFDDEEA